MIQNMK